MPNYTLMGLKQEYTTKFKEMVITRPAVNHDADLVIKGKDTYKQLESLTGVPWIFIGICHLRESSCNFHTHLHNGDSLNRRTVHVPAGRPIKGSPPFTFIESAVDCLNMEGFTKIKSWPIEQFAFSFETMNGFGYRMNGVPSAYLWAGTNQYHSGKYVSDGVFDPTVVDVQNGTMAVLKAILEKEGIMITTAQPVVVVKPAPVTPPPSPKAEPPQPTTNQMNTVSRKYWWTDWLQWLSGTTVVTSTVLKTAQSVDLEATKTTIQTLKEITDMVGIYVVILLALGLFAYAIYMKFLMRQDVTEGRYTPSQGEEAIVPVPPVAQG